MSKTLNVMAVEIAEAIGGQNNAKVIAEAKRQIKASIEDWNSAKDWYFLLKDTSNGFTIPSVTLTDTETSVTSPSTGALDAVNTGSTVSGTGIPASSFVGALTRNTDGTIASFTLVDSADALVAITATGTVTLTFGAHIPIRANVSTYSLPADFTAPYNARTISNQWNLNFIRQRQWNRTITDHNATGFVTAYTIYNPVSSGSQNFGTTRLRVYRTPSASDSIFLEYFRKMDPEATTVDIPDEFLYKFEDYAKWRVLREWNSEDSRVGAWDKAAQVALAASMAKDEDLSDDEEVRLISQMDGWNYSTVPWTNGQFSPLAGGW